ncbi:MAG: triose-phosphate isomerase [Chloroflexi bacterium]|nr:triose-phosphate isomerase [Chloroflexota bacterium]
MRTPLVAGNWKMNTTISGAVALAGEVAAGVEHMAAVDVAVYPPFVALQSVARALHGTRTSVGAQNMHFEESGAFTGEVSPNMLDGVVASVILGHSERRHIFGEPDELVARKVRSAFDHGLTPVFCVGEQLAERESGRTEEVVGRQVGFVVDQISPAEAARMIIAYEPVWAIGTGVNATPDQAEDACAFIRDLIDGSFGQEAAGRARVLYGGSVNTGNWDDITRRENVDGALVGGASLDAPDFVRLVEITRDALPAD